MKGTITKIDPPRVGTKGKMYRLVCFKLENGGSVTSFISQDMKNYKRWLEVLEVGNILDGLRMKGPHVDGDSEVTLFFKPDKQPELNL